jgi:hypothetical protein
MSTIPAWSNFTRSLLLALIFLSACTIFAAENAKAQKPEEKGLFVAVGDTGAVYSCDGINWLQSSPMPIKDTVWESVVYGKGVFVAVTGYGGAYSTDGAQWRPCSGYITKANWHAVAYGKGNFVAISADGEIARSSNGRNWEKCRLSEELSMIGSWESLVFGGDKFMVLASIYAGGIYSTDGVIWTKTAKPLIQKFSGVKPITFGAGQFVIMSGEQSAYSKDGM